VLTKVVDADPLCWLTFTQEAIMTSCKSGTSTLPELRVAFSALSSFSLVLSLSYLANFD
jgi:hypothetical protein